MLKFFLFLFISLFAFHSQAKSKAKRQPDLKANLVTSLKGIPWGIEFISPDEMLITLKQGEVFIFNLKTKKTLSVKGAPKSSVHGQGGLLDVMLHPEFKTNSILFFSYTKKVKGGYTTAIAYGTLSKNKIKDLKEIFVANNPNNNHEHFGSRFVHDGKGHLFFTVGERGERDLAQRLDADQGKVHRLNLDGTVPKDNPFFNKKGARNTIWSFGHRNPQGLVYDFKNQILYEQEHGPRGGDEINIIEKGKNYGWPEVTFGREYYGPKISKFTSKKGYADPLYQFTPSIAPSGLELYTGEKLPFLKDSLISGALALTHLNVLKINNPKKMTETRYFEDLNERIRDVKQSPNGELYFSTDTGKIYQVISNTLK